MKQRLGAEALGSFFLFATVVGSGIMGEKLAGGNVAVALLANTGATAAMLYVLIAMLGPVSGAHFNPAVSLVMRLRGDGAWPVLAATILVQIAAGIAGVWCAHAMFGLPILQLSHHLRDGPGQWLGEFIATFGLATTILLTLRHRPQAVPASVALYIAAAYWFTSSTSFANPAITLARSLSDSFAGIAPASVPGFIAAQIAGALAAHWLERRLLPAS
ncbi:MAG: aquaporin [Proteobacteria bacterium]|nr:aquaporin [Pseudomonadota bacterium]